jgi:glycosyltransferase involved in cell wall biosynthesis
VARSRVGFVPDPVATDPPRRRRRVWIVNQYAAGPDEPAGTRHYELARQLIARGHRVTIFAASFHHGLGRDRVAWGRGFMRRETINGVRFVWLRTIPYEGNTIRRQLNMLSFMPSFLLAQARLARPDIVIGSTVHPFAALAAWASARLRRARFAFEIRDLWPQTLVDLGALRRGALLERVLRWIEALLVRHADAVISLLPGIRDYLRGEGLPDGHVVYLPNGAAVDNFLPGATLPEPTSDAADVIAAVGRMRADGRFVLGYLGTFGRVNRVDLLVEAAARAEARAPGRIGLVVVGDGPERPELEAAAAGRPGIAVMPAIPKVQVPRVLRAFDALVVHTTYTPVYRYGISFNKLFEYMAAAKPVVFACTTAYDPVESVAAGITITPDDATALADAYLRLADEPAEALAAMGAAGLDYVRREHDFDRLGDTLNAVVEGRLPVRDTRPEAR